MGYTATTGPVKTNGRLDLYVAGDAVGASDTNQGTTTTTPLKTFNEAVRRCNTYDEISALFVIHIAPAPVAGYSFTTAFGQHILRENIVVIGDGAGQGGDGFTQLLASTAAIAGSSNAQVVVTAGLGVNTYRGKTIEILTGAAKGDRRTIRDHTDTTIIPSRNFTAAVAATDTFRIVEPAATITINTGSLAENAVLGDGVGFNASQYSGDLAMVIPGLVFVNLIFAPVAASLNWIFQSAFVVFFGCEVAGTGSIGASFQGPGSSLLMGCQYAATNALAPIALSFPTSTQPVPTTTTWSGWGCYLKNGATFSFNFVGGFFVGGDTVNARFFSNIGETFAWLGGSISTVNGFTAFGFSVTTLTSRLIIGAVNSIAPAVAIANTAGTNAALDIGGGGNVVAGIALYLRRCTLSAPVLLRTIGPVSVQLAANTLATGTGTTLGIDCGPGSNINASGAPGLLGPAGADLSVDGGTTSIAVATLAAVGASLTNQITQACIRRVA